MFQTADFAVILATLSLKRRVFNCYSCIIYHRGSGDSSVDIVAKLRVKLPRNRRSISGTGKGILYSAESSDRP